MKINVSVNINYYAEAIGILTTITDKVPFTDRLKESFYTKYNIPCTESERILKDVSKIYDFVTKNINIPKEKLEFYFGEIGDSVPRLGEILLYFLYCNDSKESIESFLKLPTQEKVISYFRTFFANYDNDLAEKLFNDFSDKQFINYISMLNIENEAKMKYILLYYNLEDYLSEIFPIVEHVISILKQKDELIKKLVSKFEKQMNEKISSCGEKLLEYFDIKIDTNNNHNIVIRPLVMLTNTIIMRPNACELCQNINIKNQESLCIYIGISINSIIELKEIYFVEDEKIISTIKALGDKSKFDILKLVKNKQMYGVEIAKSLNLTTATVSHHMANLYNLSLVNVVTDNNKVNYMINKDTIAEVIKALENIFLG